MDDAILELRSQCRALAEAVDRAEANVGPDALMQAQELRQIETINGVTDVVPPARHHHDVQPPRG